MLRIGIDGFNLALRNGTGIASYGFALAETLKSAGHEIHGFFGLETGKVADLREVLFFDAFAREQPKNRTRKEIRRSEFSLLRRSLPPRLTLQADPVPLTARVEKVVFADRLPNFDALYSTPRLFDIAWKHFQLHRRFLTLRTPSPPDVMHWTYPIPVRLAGAKNVYVLHDIVPLKLPYATLDAKGSYSDVIEECIRTGDHICTVSEASLDDIVNHFKIDRSFISNTYQISSFPDVDARADPEEDAAMVQGIFGLQPKGYFLYFGAIEPKKNVGRLIEAYLSTQTETPLVIVGGKGWQSEEQLALLGTGRSPGAQRVVQLEYLARPLLGRLIRCARAVAFPSLYEGFGLPVLEALRFGTPVLTSNTSSLPEVGGDGAIYVDPYDSAAIAKGLKALDSDGDLRRSLSAAGLVQAERFSKSSYLARLETMYDTVLGL